MYQESLVYAEHALELNPTDERLQNNVKLIKEFLKEKLDN
jgi:hypothetical protein